MVNVYGDNEVLIGKWFKLYFECCVDIFLVIKFGIKVIIIDKGEWFFLVDNSFEFFNECFEGSLKKMGVDYVDFYYVYCFDFKMFVEKMMELMVKVKK